MSEVNVIEGLAEVVAERLSRRRPVDRLALTKQEAADSLGISVDHLERHVIADLRVVRSGRLVLIPRAELDRWLDRRASLTLTLRGGSREPPGRHRAPRPELLLVRGKRP